MPEEVNHIYPIYYRENGEVECHKCPHFPDISIDSYRCHICDYHYFARHGVMQCTHQ